MKGGGEDGESGLQCAVCVDGNGGCAVAVCNEGSRRYCMMVR